MAALPYMQLYVADYLADTLYLDVVESGAYLHLLMNYWQTGKPLPDDDKKLARIARCSEEQWFNVRSTVVDYFVQRDGQLIHNRVEADLDKVRKKSEQSKAAGRKSARKRAQKPQSNETGNETPATAERPLERSLNHTDTDTDTDTDNSLSHSRSEKFAKAWGRWEEHRRQKLAPLGAIEADSQQMELSRCFPGEADQIAAIEFSIARGAKNLITNGDHKRAPPKTSGSNQGQTAFERVGL